jgi:hypothetical protein
MADIIDKLKTYAQYDCSYIESLITTKGSTFDGMLTQEIIVLSGKDTVIHRVYLSKKVAGPYFNVGWVLDGDVDECMICNRTFSAFFLLTKHHCRSCGNIVCSDCSSSEGV